MTSWDRRRDSSSLPDRQLWLGNVPLHYRHQDVRQAFGDQGFPTPAYAVLQQGGRNTQWSIVTMHSIEAANYVYFEAQGKWNAFIWEKDQYAVVRRSKGNVQCAPMWIILSDRP